MLLQSLLGSRLLAPKSNAGILVVPSVPDTFLRFAFPWHAPRTNLCMRELHSVQTARFADGVLDVGVRRSSGHIALRDPSVEITPYIVVTDIVNELGVALHNHFAIRQ